MHYFCYEATPFGRMLLVANESALCGAHFVEDKYIPEVSSAWRERRDAPPIVDAVCQLQEYFAGARARFDLRIEPEGTTFQRDVWKALLDVPYGTTATYRDIATRLGKPQACRAVGAANSRNPISIIVPCHRVIGVDGSLTGYASGVERKRALLGLEAAGQHALREQSVIPLQPGQTHFMFS
jgi:methylated-DNA-[protein]-cysteine S-methyltransferase